MYIQSWGKRGVLAYFGPKISYFGVSLLYKQRAFIIYDNDVTLTNMFKRF